MLAPAALCRNRCSWLLRSLYVMADSRTNTCAYRFASQYNFPKFRVAQHKLRPQALDHTPFCGTEHRRLRDPELPAQSLYNTGMPQRLPPLLLSFFFVCSLGLTVRTLPHLRLSCLLGCTACAGTMLSSIRTVMALQPIEVTVGILTIYTQVGGLCGGDWEGSKEGDIQNKIGRIKQ